MERREIKKSNIAGYAHMPGRGISLQSLTINNDDVNPGLGIADLISASKSQKTCCTDAPHPRRMR